MDAPVKCLASTLKPSVGRKSVYKSRFWRRDNHIHGCERSHKAVLTSQSDRISRQSASGPLTK